MPSAAEFHLTSSEGMPQGSRDTQFKQLVEDSHKTFSMPPRTSLLVPEALRGHSLSFGEFEGMRGDGTCQILGNLPLSSKDPTSLFNLGDIREMPLRLGNYSCADPGSPHLLFSLPGLPLEQPVGQNLGFDYKPVVSYPACGHHHGWQRGLLSPQPDCSRLVEIFSCFSRPIGHLKMHVCQVPAGELTQPRFISKAGIEDRNSLVNVCECIPGDIYLTNFSYILPLGACYDIEPLQELPIPTVAGGISVSKEFRHRNDPKSLLWVSQEKEGTVSSTQPPTLELLSPSSNSAINTPGNAFFSDETGNEFWKCWESNPQEMRSHEGNQAQDSQEQERNLELNFGMRTGDFSRHPGMTPVHVEGIRCLCGHPVVDGAGPPQGTGGSTRDMVAADFSPLLSEGEFTQGDSFLQGECQLKILTQPLPTCPTPPVICPPIHAHDTSEGRPPWFPFECPRMMQPPPLPQRRIARVGMITGVKRPPTPPLRRVSRLGTVVGCGYDDEDSPRSSLAPDSPQKACVHEGMPNDEPRGTWLTGYGVDDAWAGMHVGRGEGTVSEENEATGEFCFGIPDFKVFSALEGANFLPTPPPPPTTHEGEREWTLSMTDAPHAEDDQSEEGDSEDATSESHKDEDDSSEVEEGEWDDWTPPWKHCAEGLVSLEC